MTPHHLRWLLPLLLLLLVACQPNSEITHGGRLYDTWWVEAETEPPQGDHPLWAAQSTNQRSGSDTWRCKECHGWDYLGVEGAYGSGSHATGFPGVLDARDLEEEALIAILSGESDPDHDFSGPLSAADLRALARFLRQGVTDPRPLVGASGRANGDPVQGQRLYGNGCIGCHGAGGDEMNSGDPSHQAVDLGALARDNPWEVLHKSAFGQPGVPGMRGGLGLNWSTQDLADLLAYLQSL